jgi:GrpB-like predicted nucleotidyltransferase (UPF0157 family)
MIEIVPYDPAWPAAFAVERDRLRTALGDLALRIDHNGSTAVPGLAAKPVIDIQISVANVQNFAACAPPLAQLGYSHLAHADDDRCPFFYRPSAWPHTHHLHVVEAGGEEERRTLAFRDYLRQHADAAREYAALKFALAAEHGGGTAEAREAYANAKSSFVSRILDAALPGFVVRPGV